MRAACIKWVGFSEPTLDRGEREGLSEEEKLQLRYDQ